MNAVLRQTLAENTVPISIDLDNSKAFTGSNVHNSITKNGRIGSSSSAPDNNSFLSQLVDKLVGYLTGEWPEMPDLVGGKDSNPLTERGVLAWHSIKTIAAIAINDVLYFFDAQTSRISAQTNLQEVKHILCMEWLEESDTLLVGFINGVAIWRDIYIDPHGTFTSVNNKPVILRHPRGKPIHEISVCPRGRSFVTMTRGEKKIYLWDSYNATESYSPTPIYCLRSTLVRSIKWAPAGTLLMATDQSGGLSLVDCLSWQADFCDKNLRLDPGFGFENVCWLSDFVCIFNLKETRFVYSCNIITDDVGTSKIQGQFIGMPLSLNFTGRVTREMRTCLDKKKALTTDGELVDNIVISKMVSHRSRGNFVAVEFQFKQASVEHKTKITKLPLIALYIPGTSPHLSMTLIKVIEPSPSLRQDLHNLYPIDFKFKFAKDMALNFGTLSGR